MRDNLLPHYCEVIDCRLQSTEIFVGRIPHTMRSVDHSVPRPLLVGCSVTHTDDDLVVILGGGATCFSMGTYWNRGTYTFNTDINKECTESLDYIQTVEIVPGVANGKAARFQSERGSAPEVHLIPRVPLQSAEEFETMLRRGDPAILSDLGLGSCVTRWGLDYMVDKLGPERKVNYISALTGPVY